MTFDDELHLQILAYFIKNGSVENGVELKKAFNNILGNSYIVVIDDLVKLGLIENYYIKPGDHFPRAYRITTTGQRKYNYLKNKKRWQPIIKMAFWATLLSAIVSAAYAMLSYYQPKKEQQQRQDLQKVQSIIRQETKTKPDTIEAPQKKINHGDTSSKKRSPSL